MTGSTKTILDAVCRQMDIWAICSNICCRYARVIDLRKLASIVGPDHSLIPQRDERHFSERLRCPKCHQRGAFLWGHFKRTSEPMDRNFGFSVRQWRVNNHMEILLFARDVTTATVAYEALNEEQNARRLTLQHGARVIQKNH